jgi:putative DNA methylase
MRDVGSNALASSIVLALRPRTEEGETIVDRRMFTAALRETLPEKLHDLLQGSIAAVDLPQAAIGPGMAIFRSTSRLSKPMVQNVSAGRTSSNQPDSG